MKILIAAAPALGTDGTLRAAASYYRVAGGGRR